MAGRREESEIYLPDFLRVAYTARFDPAALASAGGPLLQSPSALAIAARGALAFDLPDVELAFGGMLAGLEDAPPALHASGQVAQGVALMALGRPSAALVALDARCDMVLLCNQQDGGGVAIDRLLDGLVDAVAAGRWQPDPAREARRLALLPTTPPLTWDLLMRDPAYQRALERLP